MKGKSNQPELDLGYHDDGKRYVFKVRHHWVKLERIESPKGKPLTRYSYWSPGVPKTTQITVWNMQYTEFHIRKILGCISTLGIHVKPTSLRDPAVMEAMQAEFAIWKKRVAGRSRVNLEGPK